MLSPGSLAGAYRAAPAKSNLYRLRYNAISRIRYTSQMSPIHLKVREFREARGWSQAELADRAGTSQPKISGLETGRTTRLDLPLLERVADALGVEPGALFVKASTHGRT